ncbi:MAG TPA: hypothetical protein VGV89_09955 [Thermoplasmata archaeon]|nr:hypothetical protein [Thermoplasmata archaeon]
MATTEAAGGSRARDRPSKDAVAARPAASRYEPTAASVLVSTSTPETDAKETDHKHLHVRLADHHGSVLDLITEYLQAAGKAPDWYWRLAGRLEGTEPDNVDDLVSSAFEAGAFIAHDHPEDLKFEWVSEEECERERKASERGQSKDDSKKDRSTMSHYA